MGLITGVCSTYLRMNVNAKMASDWDDHINNNSLDFLRVCLNIFRQAQNIGPTNRPKLRYTMSDIKVLKTLSNNFILSYTFRDFIQRWTM